MADSTEPSSENSHSECGPPAEIAWKSNDLVLDAIFKLLPVSDLANVRLTCKCFAKAASRALAKKAVVHLTDWTFAGRNAVAEFRGAFDFRPQLVRNRRNWKNLDDMWECECKRSERRIRYFSIDHDSFKSSVRGTDFRPKKAVLLGYTCAAGVAATFSSVEELEVRTHTGPQEEKLVDRVAATALFPNLKVLVFRDIIPHTQTCPSEEDAFSTCHFCEYFWDIAKKDCRLTFTSILDQWCPVDQVAASPELLQLETAEGDTMVPELPSFKSPLRHLRVQISPHCPDRDFAVLKCFPKLEVLEVLWWRVYPFGGSAIYPRYAHVAACYGSCLEKMLPHILACTSIKRLVLSVYLFWSDIHKIQTVLNELKIATLSLQVSGALCDLPDVEMSTLVAFFTGLQGYVVQALDTLHLNLNNIYRGEAIFLDLLFPLFQELHRKGFFQKPKWKFILYLPWSVWIRLERSCDGLVFQMSSAGREILTTFDFESLIAYMNPSEDYNYAFHRVKSINDFENLNSSALYRPYFLTAHWTCMERLVCDECRSYPRLLCDLPGFRQEAKLPCPEEHAQEHFVRTWIFSFVPRHLLAKWTLELVSEIAAWKSKKTCNCDDSCWDVVSRFKKIYAFQFTDADCLGADQLEAMDPSWYNQPKNDKNWFESTLSSWGFVKTRMHIFLPRHIQPDP